MTEAAVPQFDTLSTTESIQTIDDSKIQIFIRDLEGKGVAMRVTPEVTVKEFQKMVRAKTGIRRHNQQLSYGGKNIPMASRGKDTSPPLLETYGLQPNSTVQLNARLKGGRCCFICIPIPLDLCF
eukprot:TRINITY_DN84698_c0_g1_i1.p1 TRINITY_DN84698_c0_g1~~TRINITY_DN84698_c0_g1_i1.p1  ORF type:complete len:125 (+),score=21.48 TRINITY_DN84698_c0_g1_i1:42-416(+)